MNTSAVYLCVIISFLTQLRDALHCWRLHRTSIGARPMPGLVDSHSSILSIWIHREQDKARRVTGRPASATPEYDCREDPRRSDHDRSHHSPSLLLSPRPLPLHVDMDIASLVDYLEIGCPCCQLDYNVWFLTGVPPPPQRHVLPDPKAALHRELMQCQFCFKSKREGVSFFRCGGCQIEIYCVRPVVCSTRRPNPND